MDRGNIKGVVYFVFKLSSHMEIHKYLPKYQYGFRQFNSTIASMLKNARDCTISMDRGNINGVVYFDFQKAFDTVDHEVLLCKLNKYDISGVEFNWFKSDLSDHKQTCILNEESSSFNFVNPIWTRLFRNLKDQGGGGN